MIVCNVDEKGEVLTMSYGSHVSAEDMKSCLGTVRDLMDKLNSGFVLLTDLSNLESMDPSCATDLGAIMELCSAKDISSEVRVVPDVNKDIGFDLISRFHHHPQVRTVTHQSLADAIKTLIRVSPDAAPEKAAPGAEEVSG